MEEEEGIGGRWRIIFNFQLSIFNCFSPVSACAWDSCIQRGSLPCPGRCGGGRRSNLCISASRKGGLSWLGCRRGGRRGAGSGRRRGRDHLIGAEKAGNA